jgi:tetratricopeptide (TPR) repeat protein
MSRDPSSETAATADAGAFDGTAAERLRRVANARAAARDWPAATDAFAALAAATPDDAAAWIGLAKAADLAGRPRRAHAAALAAAAAGPASWGHALALVRLLRGVHEVPALRALAARMRAEATHAPLADRVEVADLLGGEDLHDDARAWLDDIVRDAPDHAPARYLRGTTQLFFGRMDAARADLERAVALAPHFAHAHWRLAELRGADPAGAPARIERLQRERDRVDAGSEHDIHFSYALHAELHDAGRHAEAWDSLERGMRAKRAAIRYDAADDRATFAALRATCDATFVAGPGHDPGDEAPAPVFIVGLFRSGTTLLERMLAGHPDVTDGGESAGFFTRLKLAADHPGPLAPDLVARLREMDMAALGADFMTSQAWRAHGRRVWTEKLPWNFLLAGAIARALPRARFVHMRRAPMDVCFSNLRTLYGQIAAYSYDQREMAAYWRGYDALMAHWRDTLGERLLDVDHAALVSDPKTTMRRVLAHVGLDWDPRVLDLGARDGAVSTASAAQVRGGLRRDAQPAWVHYREQLQPLAEALKIEI